MHIEPSKRCVQSFKYCTSGIGPYFCAKFQTCIPLTAFEILEFKLKNKKKNWKMTFCHVNGPILTKFKEDIHIYLSYYPVVSKVDYH